MLAADVIHVVSNVVHMVSNLMSHVVHVVSNLTVDCDLMGNLAFVCLHARWITSGGAARQQRGFWRC